MSKALLLCAFAGVLLAAVLVSKRSARAAGGTEKFDAVKQRITPRLTAELSEKGVRIGDPIFVRVFKEEKQLELWVLDRGSGRHTLFKTYAICACSGELGPKLAEGDRQGPEGFYFVTRSRMNPNSKYHLSFDLGYPNAYDRVHGRTGSFLMVHGNCVSVGCYAMTDAFIEEIYTLADAALGGGQKFFRVHCFPFRMTEERMAEVPTGHRWQGFWENLKHGFDWFEKHGVPPDVTVRDKRYAFSRSS